ncbi:hypothetical protein HYU19_03390 [Candidatus Woesearchaeota archaeon]|nr:hypothetical protein [Candidatus Woesearchaeota archaeon]
MADAVMQHLHQDMEEVKKDIALIKYILSEEGELADTAKLRLAKARKTPLSDYVEV